MLLISFAISMLKPSEEQQTPGSTGEATGGAMSDSAVLSGLRRKNPMVLA
ncbi:hypothetical protein ACFRFL_37875 [Streptomyces sp. NPDC056708]